MTSASSPPVLPVVLGVTGGLVFLVALTLGFFLIRGWRRDRALDREQVAFTEPRPRITRARSDRPLYSFHPENTHAPPTNPPAPRFVVTASSPVPQKTKFASKSSPPEEKYERPTSAMSEATTASFYPTSVMLSRTPDDRPPLPLHTVQKTFDPNERVFK